jgi:MFS transporter, DHA1 family, tetracycline resistance protein
MEERSYVRILPVLFLEYLAISLARTLFPQMIVDGFGEYSYLVVGVSETVKGLLAFLSCPMFGKLSDKIGRKPCLLLTMLGSTFPVWILVFAPSITVYLISLSFSGLFSATFSLTFAYISDCVEGKKRAPAFGMALATFGLSFTIGPLLGSYIAQEFDANVVFATSMFLVVINLIYIVVALPETTIISMRVSHYQSMCCKSWTNDKLLGTA